MNHLLGTRQITVLPHPPRCDAKIIVNNMWWVGITCTLHSYIVVLWFLECSSLYISIVIATFLYEPRYLLLWRRFETDGFDVVVCLFIQCTVTISSRK